APAPKEEKPIKAEPIKKETKTFERPSHFISKEMSAPIICSTQPRNKDGKVTLTNLDNHTCRWPVGDPKDEGFHFCGKKIRVGQTYCDEHSSIAYVRSTKK
ncbi:MAG: GcrA family cell cycle regulator, partial [Lactobacillus sp.]|nr:GcrA family cell cycle regulator [Lactobacillus sp.]